jgi:hypothetical protein
MFDDPDLSHSVSFKTVLAGGPAFELPEVITTVGTLSLRDRPPVREKAAWLGTEHIPRAIVENFSFFPGERLPPSNRGKRGVEWLVGE